MRQSRTYGSVGAPGGKPPGATRLKSCYWSRLSANAMPKQVFYDFLCLPLFALPAEPE